MEFENKKLKTKFTLPDKVTVRQQLAYFSEASNIQASRTMEKLWFASLHLIQDWQSEILPDSKKPLDELTDAKATDVIIWASLEVKKFMNDLDKIPKN